MLLTDYVPDRGRVIFSEGRWAPDATPEHRAIPLEREDAPAPQSERPPVQPREVPIVRKALRPLPKRGPSPLRFAHVTAGAVLAMRAKKKSAVAIAVSLKCSVDVVYQRLRSVNPPTPRFEVTAGYRFPGTMLVAIREVEMKDHARQVLCRCDCGAIVTAQLSAVRTGRWSSCGHMRRKLTPPVVAAIQEKRTAGARVVDLCAEFGVSDEAVRRAMKMGGGL